MCGTDQTWRRPTPAFFAAGRAPDSRPRRVCACYDVTRPGVAERLVPCETCGAVRPQCNKTMSTRCWGQPVTRFAHAARRQVPLHAYLAAQSPWRRRHGRLATAFLCAPNHRVCLGPRQRAGPSCCRHRRFCVPCAVLATWNSLRGRLSPSRRLLARRRRQQVNSDTCECLPEAAARAAAGSAAGPARCGARHSVSTAAVGVGGVGAAR